MRITTDEGRYRRALEEIEARGNCNLNGANPCHKNFTSDFDWCPACLAYAALNPDEFNVTDF